MTAKHPGHMGALAAPPLVPTELLEATRRRASMRARAARSLERAAQRRRIVPAAMVGTLVMVGVGLADLGVRSTLPTSATPASAATSSPIGGTGSALASAARALAADRVALAGFEKAARAAQLASQAAARSAAALNGSGGAGAPSSGATAPSGTLPPLAPLPALPALSAPTSHATTGASGAG